MRKLAFGGGDKSALSGFSSTAIAAVYGQNTDSGNGVTGDSQLAEGVRGISHNASNGGVVGVCDTPNGTGVFGTCDDGSGFISGTGVWGKSLSSGWGVLGESQGFEGVRGISHNSDHGGVVGICDKENGIGVYGFCDDGSRSLVGTGVFGESSQGQGVHGLAASGIGVEGESKSGPGVVGLTPNGNGVEAEVLAGAQV